MNSYSQYGEDEIVASHFPEDFKGKVLEIGAWNPTQFSNSRAFIDRGWDAVLIEPTPLAVEALVREYGNNPAVTVISAAVGLGPTPLKMTITADAVSSSDENVVNLWQQVGGYYGKLHVATLEPFEVVGLYGPFDVVSIDAEGMSVELLEQFADIWEFGGPHDCNLAKPRVIVVEFDGRRERVWAIAGRLGFKVVMDGNVNGTNMILARI